MPLLGSAKVGRVAQARCASVRMGTVGSAEAPGAKRKKERRETPLQSAGGVILEIEADDICVNSSEGWVGNSNAAWGPNAAAAAGDEPLRMFAHRERGLPISQGIVETP